MVTTVHPPARPLTAPVGRDAPPRVFFGALESLRGVAALLVAIYHVPWIHPAYHWGVVRNAYLMVDFFFVLSGFVICHGYAEKLASQRDFARYAWLRVGRLYPLHLALLLVWVGLDVAAYARRAIAGAMTWGVAVTQLHWSEIAASLVLIQGLGTHDDLIYNFPSWSISAELYVCLLFGVVVLSLGRRAPLWQVASLISIGSFAVYLVAGQPAFINPFHLAFFRCAIGFFFGVVVYQVYRRMRPTLARVGGRAWYGWLVTLTVVATIVFLDVKKINATDFAITPIVGLLVLLVAGAQGGIVLRVLHLRPLVWLGRVSYSIYMVHALVHMLYSVALTRLLRAMPQFDAGVEMVYSRPRLHPTPLVSAAFLLLAIGSVCLLSHLTYSYIEDPFRKKSKEQADRWFSSRARV